MMIRNRKNPRSLKEKSQDQRGKREKGKGRDHQVAQDLNRKGERRKGKKKTNREKEKRRETTRNKKKKKRKT